MKSTSNGEGGVIKRGVQVMLGENAGNKLSADVGEALKFLNAIWGFYSDIEADCYAIVAISRDGAIRYKHFCLSELGDYNKLFSTISQYLETQLASPGLNVYFQVLPLAAKPTAGRGSARDVRVGAWLWADLDFKEVVGKAEFEGCKEGNDHSLRCYYRDGENWVKVDRPPLSEVLRAVREKLGFEPAIIVDSGAGYHIYFRLAYSIDAHRLSKLEEKLVDLLGGDPQSKDLARILRLPGTVNTRVNRLARVIISRLGELIDPEELEGRLAQLPPPPSFKPTAHVMRELTPQQIGNIVKLLARAYRPGYRNSICLYLSGWGAKNYVSPVSIAEVIKQLYTKTNDTDPLKQRAAALVYSYKKAGVGLEPYADRLREIFGVDPYGLERELQEERVKGYSGLQQVLSEALGQEEAAKVVAELAKIVETAEPAEEIKLLAAKVKPSRLDRLAAPIVSYIMKTRIIKAFYRPGSDEVIGIFCFDGVRYHPCEAELEREVYSKVKELDQSLDGLLGTRVVREVLGRIRTRTLTELHYEPMLIAFKNGKLLDWDCLLKNGGSIFTCVTSPSPDTVVFHLIPHRLRVDLLEEYMKEKGIDSVNEVDPMDFLERAGPKIAKALRDWVGDKAILLLEAVGYVLYPSYDLHKAFMLVGDGRNGKSTYLRLLKDSVGAENAVSIALQSLVGEEGRFMRAKLYHKLLNVYPDLPSKALRETGEFKALTGEDTITADRKHRDAITFVNYAKLFFSANALPEVFDQSSAFWRRWVVVEFPNTFPQNPTFYDTIKGEIEPLIVAGILAFAGAWRRRKFSFEETEADYKHRWQYSADSVYAFLYDAERLGVIRRSENARCETAQLYELYVKYCDANERDALDKASFTKRLESMGIGKTVLHGRHYYKNVEILLTKWPEEAVG